MTETKKLVTVSEAAEIIGVSVQSIHQYSKQGKLTVIKDGRSNTFDIEEVHKVRDSRGGKRSKPAEEKSVVEETTESASPVPVPPPDNPMLEVPIRSRIMLSDQARAWKMNMEKQEWEPAEASGILVVVTERMDNGGQMFLMGRAEGSNAIWGFAEADVLSEKFKVVSRPVQVPQTPPMTPVAAVEAQPEPTVESEAAPEVLAETTEAPTEETVPEPTEAEVESQDFLGRKISYSKAIQVYGEANEDKLGAAERFKAVDKANRGVIWDYLMDFGSESEDGKNDRVISDFGYKAILTFTAGVPYVTRDVNRIMAWALENGKRDLLKVEVALDIDKWDELKESGDVPVEFIQEVETVEKPDDTRKLIVSKIKGEK